MEYRKRIADELLQDKLDAIGAVLIEGPKACGKTTTAEQKAASILYMDDPNAKDSYIKMAQLDINVLLEGATPRLIDEWQLVPSLWDAIRFKVDHREGDGQFILTGSSVPQIKEGDITHSGAGRFGRLKMYPMTLWESGESKGAVSIRDLFNQNFNASVSANLSLRDIAFLTCRGGWPRALQKKTEKAAIAQAIEYTEIIVNSDITRADGVMRDAARVRRMMRSYARNQGAQVSINGIVADMKSNEDSTFGENTVASYLAALKKIFIVDDLPAWNPNLRSRTAIRTSDTRYYIDPSIATSVMGLGPDDLMEDLNTFGLFFETMAVRDLRVYAEANGGQLFHYRDKNGLECDAVIHLRNGSYGLIEIKLGGEDLIEAGAESLTTLASSIDTSKMKSPSFMMVLTAVGEFAYRRSDGVYVVPITALKD